jgi:hypothetical protein
MEKKKKINKKRETKKEREEKEQKKIRTIADSEKILERKIKKLDEELREPQNKIQLSGFVEDAESLELLNPPSPLEKTNAQQRTHVVLERSIMSSNPSITKVEEENPIKYSLMPSENKKEAKYSVISKDYSVIQRETMKQNPSFLVQANDFNESGRRNVLEEFPKRNINPIAEESLRGSEKKDGEYFVKPSFIEKERKPHNPFERKEIQYDKFEQ